MIRVLIRATAAIPRAGLESVFRASAAFEVVGGEGDGGELGTGGDLLADAAPDVVVADVESQDDEVVHELTDWAATGGAVVVLVDGPVGSWARDLLRAGVKAVLPNRVGEAELLAAVEAAAAGLVSVHPDDLETVLPPRGPASGGTPAALVEPLTPREVEVLRLVAEGIGNKEIAARLGISEHTVKFHIASILGKLGATTRTEAVTLGIRHGLILI